MNHGLATTQHSIAEEMVGLVRARPMLGTIVEISATGQVFEKVQEAIECAFKAIKMVHHLMSYQDPDSDVSRLNKMAYSQPVEVSQPTWHVLQVARNISEASGGIFDITIAPALTRLGFLPQHEGFPESWRHSHWRHVDLLPGNKVRFQRSLGIDLSGIAKGYAVDLAIQALQMNGMKAGRINAGGDMRMFGNIQHSIHVRMPDAPTQTVPLVKLECGAIATSAGYYAAKQHGGLMLTPLVDPLTQTACESGRSVSVLADECIIADALTKVAYIAPKCASDILHQFQAHAIIVEKDSKRGNYQIFDSRVSQL